MGKLDILIIIVLIMGYLLYKSGRTEVNLRTTFNDNDEMKSTLLIGLFHRFRKDEIDKQKETPFDFEVFVAKVFESYFGGSTRVTPGSGDGGIDIIHDRADGRYLGQVKCYSLNYLISTDVIQRVHSQMVLQKAKGGFVAATCGYQPKAIEYAKKANIKLYDGQELVEMWVYIPGTNTVTEQFRRKWNSIKWAYRDNSSAAKVADLTSPVKKSLDRNNSKFILSKSSHKTIKRYISTMFKTKKRKWSS